MKHLLTLVVIFASFYASSQAIARITSPDQTICACDNAVLSSATSSPGSSPIVRTIWSIIGCGVNIADTTLAGQNLVVQLCTTCSYDISIINQHQNGTASAAQAAQFITVNSKPVATISAVVNSCTVPFGVTYSNPGPVPGITSAWTFQGTTPATFNGDNPPLINYATAGNYNVSLIVTNTLTGCKDTATQVMNVSNFDAGIILPTGPLCAGQQLQFTDNSTVGASTWNWTFENGSPASSSAQNPTSSFPAGTHDITLLSGNPSIGCNGTITMQITVLANPIPDFTATPLLGCAPLDVTFTNNNIQAGATYLWNYGDTFTFTGSNSPIHTYTGNGTFTPTLTMTDQNGCFGTFTGLPIVLTSPVAAFTQVETNFCEPKIVTFNPAASTAPGPIATFTWIFGDGTPNVVNVTNAPINHPYLCGLWTPTLVIQMVSGCIDTLVGTEIKVGTHTVPDFFVDHHNDCIKSPFILTDITDIACPHQPSEVINTWLFNKVPGGTGVIFSKTFPDTMQNIGPNGLPGTDLGLIINFRGCIDTTLTVDSIYISAPVSRFSLDKLLFCDVNQQASPLNKTVAVDDSQSIYGHKWLSNGLPVNPQILDSTVANLAFDQTEVTFRWGDGTADFYETNAQGLLDPFLEDDLDHATNVDPLNATLNPTTTANPLKHIYNDYGTYQVWQIIKNYNSMGLLGCVDSTSVTVNVSWVETDYVFDMTPDEVCINNPFNFTSTSGTHGLPTSQTNPHTPLSYSFDMVSGGTVTGSGSTVNQTFSHTYFVPGVYNVTLTTTNAVGCSTSVVHPVTAYALPVASFTLDDVDGCIGIQYTSNATNTSSHPAGSFGASGASNANWATTDAFHWQISPNGGTVTNPVLSAYNPGPSSPINNTTTFSLFVIDGFGCQSPTVSVTANVQQPTAQFVLPSTVCNGTSVDAIDISSAVQPSTRDWFFNTAPDGTPDGTGITFTKILTSAGLSQTYQYCMIVKDNLGCPDTLCQNVTVSKPVADFTSVKSGASVDAQGNFTCPPVAVNFTNTSQSVGTIVSTEWYLNTVIPTQVDLPGFPLIPTSTQNSPQGIQYLFADTYDVSLIITDDAGCKDTMSIDDFLVIQGPSADHSILPAATVCGQTFDYNITNEINVVSWSWNLGDATTVVSADSIPPFSYTYSGVQTYYPVLSIEDANGCVVNYFDTLTIQPNGVTANFSFDPQSGIGLGTFVTFDPTGSSSNGGNISTWNWNYGDNSDTTLTTGSNVSHQYFIGGDIPVTLLVTDDRGCTDDMTLFLKVDVNFDFPNVFTGLGSNGPNADLQLFADVFKDFEILLVNRWGNVVYEGKRDPLRPRYLWNGIDQKSGKLCNDGTYFYRVKGILKNDVPVDINGFVTLIATVRP